LVVGRRLPHNAAVRAPLPIDVHIEPILARVRERGSAVIVAAPGAGKTTRVPPALAEDGPVILLQPRRLAARALARRIAGERSWTLGQEVGWQVRFERRYGRDTRLLVATEGILTARLQSDPLLTAFRTVVLDEFHERSLHGDLALALLREAREARPELRIVVMSATLDAAPVADFLGGAPVIEIPGRAHALDIDHAPGKEPATACVAALGKGAGDVLCFLPGAPEIRRVMAELQPRCGNEVAVLPLHGSLEAAEQDRALAPSSRRKLVVATNIAETSLTVEGVTTVVDSGLQKVMRRDPASGLDRLETERVSRDAADQRAGRAGRTGPGRVVRLWDERDELRAHREAEIHRVDLAAPLLEIYAWGAVPERFGWYEAPASEDVESARRLLQRLGAVRDDRVTPLGRRMRGLPLHPRLARLLLGAGADPLAAAACAALSAGFRLPAERRRTARSDLWNLADAVKTGPRHLQAAARQLARLAGDDPELAERAGDDETRFLHAVLAAYPDRVAQRRSGGSDRLLLASGAGAVLDRNSGVRDDEWLVAVEIVAGRRGAGSEARVRVASALDKEWLAHDHEKVLHRLDPATGRVRAVRQLRYGALVLQETDAETDPGLAASLLCEAMLRRGLGDDTDSSLRRLAFAGISFELEERLLSACTGRNGWFTFDPLQSLSWQERKRLEELAPERLAVPSARTVPLEYREDGSVVAAVKLQELFGLAETPRVGSPPVPVTLSLLAPNGRPVQTTQDLRSFWEVGYAEVRKQLRGRYPKHPWPEDPWSARPTARTKKRS
jgi:ATP-dependent helicase HrpB